MGLVVALDYDGTLVAGGAWRPHAREVVKALAESGHRLILHTCRLTPRDGEVLPPAAPQEVDEFWRTGIVAPDLERQWARLAEMRGFLQADGCWELFELWDRPGKPEADIYVDDRGEPADLLALWRQLVVAS